jgi:prevent-host-death family protein
MPLVVKKHQIVNREESEDKVCYHNYDNYERICTMLSIRPISDLRNRFSEVEEEVNKNSKPIIFTTNGQASMVTMSFDKFTKLAHLDYIENALDEADAYAEENQEILTHKDVFSKIKSKVNG